MPRPSLTPRRGPVLGGGGGYGPRGLGLAEARQRAGAEQTLAVSHLVCRRGAQPTSPRRVLPDRGSAREAWLAHARAHRLLLRAWPLPGPPRRGLRCEAAPRPARAAIQRPVPSASPHRPPPRQRRRSACGRPPELRSRPAVEGILPAQPAQADPSRKIPLRASCPGAGQPLSVFRAAAASSGKAPEGPARQGRARRRGPRAGEGTSPCCFIRVLPGAGARSAVSLPARPAWAPSREVCGVSLRVKAHR